MEEGSVAVLVDAKEEYTKQLISILKSCIYQGIKSIYMDAKDICNQDNTPDNILMVFQDLLSRIPKWSQDIINKEYERISNVSKCDYIEDLLKVVYVSHIKILTIVHSAQKNKKISLKVPSGSHFIHLCYIECAREFWKDPYYFSDRVTKYEHQKNMRDSENMISECIMETIRKQLPVRHILKEFLNEPDEEIEEEEDDIKEPSKKKYLKKLESVVKKELKSTSKTENIGEINIDLIRKVIREEMESRPSTDIIKKELVDTVIEKIVEKKEQENEIKVVEEIMGNVENMENAANVENVANMGNIEKKVVKEIVKTNVEEVIKEVANKSSKDFEKTVTFPSPIEQSNLEKLLSNNINDDIVDNDDDDIDDIDNDIDSNANETSNTGNKSQLVINDIDEINLNLDELDDELDGKLDDKNILNNNLKNQPENEIDLDELQSVDLNNNKIESKDNSNTKYIFFKDV
jgi:hypothetical protein